jgi:hypothetical protein
MTRTYALKRLLEHGPLTTRQMRDITGWSCRQVNSTIDCLLKCELVVMLRGKRAKWNAYAVAD